MPEKKFENIFSDRKKEEKNENEIEKNKNYFIQLVKNFIKREGINDLINYLDKNSDFFYAPASSKYHLACEGGLCKHSINVYKNMDGLKLLELGYTMESIAIVSLFHDICKVNFYQKKKRTFKNENGEYVTQNYYIIDDKFPYGGHGEKSVFIIERFMKLSLEESLAIRHHMGIQNDDFGSSARSFSKSKLALYVHIADLKATFIDENEEEGVTLNV